MQISSRERNAGSVEVSEAQGRSDREQKPEVTPNTTRDRQGNRGERELL